MSFTGRPSLEKKGIIRFHYVHMPFISVLSKAMLVNSTRRTIRTINATRKQAGAPDGPTDIRLGRRVGLVNLSPLRRRSRTVAPGRSFSGIIDGHYFVHSSKVRA